MDFARRLRELRTQRELSQAELARKLGVSKSRISMYELGSREPDFETLELIADFFNVDMDYLLGKENVSTYILTPEKKEIVDVISDDGDLLMLMLKAKNKDYRRRLLKWIEIMEAYEKGVEEK